MREGGPGFPLRSNPGYGNRFLFTENDFLFTENESSEPRVADRFIMHGLNRCAVRRAGVGSS
jgi:hypothetical protein